MYSVTVLAHRLLGALLLPPILNLLPIIAGGMLIRRWPHAGRLLLASGVALTYFLSIPQTAIWLAHGLERYPVIDAAQLADVDAIVVLGGGKRPAEEFGGNAPGGDTLTRCARITASSRAGWSCAPTPRWKTRSCRHRCCRPPG